MHILLTANSGWNIWHFRRSLVEALIADGHIVTILAPFDKSTTNLEQLGCKFVPIMMNLKSLNPLEPIMLIRLFKHAFKQQRPDIVLSYTIKNNIFGAIAARSLALPFIPNITGLGTAFLSGWLVQTAAEVLYRFAFQKLPVIFFQNGDDSDLFLKRRLVRADQAQVLPGSGIDLSHFNISKMPFDNAPPVFLMIARLLRDKGVMEFIEAARQIKAHNPDIRFQLLGASGSQNRTAISAATVQEWVDEGIVEYLGITPDVRPHIVAASCVVLPSYREGAPRTLIEAAAMARPLTATDVPGCRSIIDQDVSGFFCDVRSADSLGLAIKRFLDLQPQDRLAMGIAGRAKMEREFDDTIVLHAYRKAIATLMKAA